LCFIKNENENNIATSIELVSGANQTAAINSQLDSSIIVIVKDQNGVPFEGSVVNFMVSEGSVSSSSIITDYEGKACVFWTLGQSLGSQSLSIKSYHSDGETDLTGSPLIVSANAVEPNTIEIISGNNQTGNIVTKLENSIEILVKDQNDDPLKGQVIYCSLNEGSVSSSSDTTNSDGIVTVYWTLGSTIGTQTMEIISYKLDGITELSGSPIIAHATATPIEDYDGNTYNAVIIGNQTWLAENLKVTHYPDGTPIPLVEDGNEWGNLNHNDPAYCFYNNNANGERDIYGALYTWEAAMGGEIVYFQERHQGVCPDGWHIPTVSEWTELSEYLGGNSIAGGLLFHGKQIIIIPLCYLTLILNYIEEQTLEVMGNLYVAFKIMIDISRCKQ
jgi:uncharacterized protein (TIGR02145 family)